jgi:murein DD-endopeptidase MepM/ murein hydrolase activator NlpD
MNRWGGILLCALLSALSTFLLHEPISAALNKMAEPYFGYPVRLGSGAPAIRSDGMGDGEFGAKRRNGRSHNGIDIQAPVGTPVYASKSGIAFRGNVPTGYGRYVMIYHPDGAQTIYGHLSNWAIRATQRVRKGDLMGFVGKTGNASGRQIQPHLHFEIRKGGEPQDPQGIMR